MLRPHVENHLRVIKQGFPGCGDLYLMHLNVRQTSVCRCLLKSSIGAVRDKPKGCRTLPIPLSGRRFRLNWFITTSNPPWFDDEANLLNFALSSLLDELEHDCLRGACLVPNVA